MIELQEHKRKLEPKTVLALMLLTPPLAWLAIFFVVPIISNLSTALQTGSLEQGYKVTWNFKIFYEAFIQFHAQFFRSFWYAFLATIICIVLGYPLAYVVAFKAGKWRKPLIAMIVAPFFTSLLVRTVAWRTILSDQGIVVEVLKKLHILVVLKQIGFIPTDQAVLFTPLSVVAGLAYNFLPFMILPLYTSLTKIDHRLLDASSDLYGKGWATFRHIIWPLSLPGVVSGVVLTFIPAAGDYVNAQLLGSAQTPMIGNVIQSQYLVTLNYPMAAAVATIFMVVVLFVVTLYISVTNVEDLL